MQLDVFKKAVSRLEEAVRQEKDNFIRDAVIQRFGFSIELAWKTTKRIMGTATSAPKDVVREMAQSGYIDDVNIRTFQCSYTNFRNCYPKAISLTTSTSWSLGTLLTVARPVTREINIPSR